jgi:formate hydrogenlyase subunit 6/NADH:ubiquinone oxidoreductase subunit I
MDFLTNCEDVCISHAIIGALEFEYAYESRSGESAHEVLNFINNTNISHTELCT